MREHLILGEWDKAQQIHCSVKKRGKRIRLVVMGGGFGELVDLTPSTARDLASWLHRAADRIEGRS